MVNGPNVAYQPAVAYQGGLANTAQQDPKNGQTQPIQAPAADTQSSDQDTSRKSSSSSSSSSSGRGSNVDVHV
jgi:hypothetical protein